MHLHATRCLAAEVPGCAQEQLDRLARSVEARRQQLEQDIAAYIAQKQHELRQYESELVEQLCSMDCAADPEAASRRSSTSAASTAHTEDLGAPPHAPPDEHKKQKKHGRVHKREQELYGLVTPVFLPLLDARESTAPNWRDSNESKPAAHAHVHSAASPESALPASNAQAPDSAESRHPPQDPSDAACAMPGDAPVKERSASDPGKKSRRSSIKKKSALRHSSTPRNRKRVSLVIDDQVVLPSDLIQEPPLTSPGSETTSATNSTASLDDMIDPRLTADSPVYIEHHEAIHHSLPLTMTAPKTSPIKSSAPPFSTPAPLVSAPTHSPPTTPPGLRSPTTAFAPPSYATRSFLDPPPDRMQIDDLPTTSGPDAIYPDPDDLPDQLISHAAAVDDTNFSTYVGGLSGGGVDDVNQVGSVGYPSSLGASYLESYMQSRPLSVRMAAATREGNAAEAGRLRVLEERRARYEREGDRGRDIKGRNSSSEMVLGDEEEWEVGGNGDVNSISNSNSNKGIAGARAGGKDDDDDDFMGSMDDF